MNIGPLEPESRMVVLQVVCTVVGIFFSLLMIEGARYIGDSFYCVAIVTGVLAIRKADAKKNKSRL
jgi:tetrahydromethanopterin S-methyltransferase subunit C